MNLPTHSTNPDYDAVIVGAGPNGLAAAITLARTGCSVLVLEAEATIGGGSRSAELTLPGFTHDVCAAIHALGVASPFFQDLPLDSYGLEWIHPPLPLTHPLDGGQAVVIRRSVSETAEGLGPDGNAYRRLFEPLVQAADQLLPELLGPIRIPRHPVLMARFGLPALRSAQGLARGRFKTREARAVFSGMAAHSMLDLTQPATASFGLVLTLSAHAVGWPLARGGSGRIVEALGSYLEDLGGEIVTNRRVRSLEELPAARAVLLDLTPRQFLDLAGEALDARHQRPYQRYRYGPGVFKIDWALDGQIPWTAEVCSQSATVHVGGSMSEIVGAEKQVWRGEHPEKPFVLVVQQSAFDACRAPQGKHTAWAYCHVPHGSTVDMRPQIEAQIERFAPGFRERILAVHTRNAADMQAYNANYIGGDINGGVQDLLQMFTRPVPRWDPYRTPLHGVYLCSSATPPGGGVHGMSGYHAARSALRALNTPMTA